MTVIGCFVVVVFFPSYRISSKDLRAGKGGGEGGVGRGNWLFIAVPLVRSLLTV